MKKDSVINDYYMKCINQKDDINNKIGEIHSGKHNDVLDKIKEKVIEKFENFIESLKTMEKLQGELKGTVEENLIWKKYLLINFRKIENLRISCNTIQKDIDRSINTQRQKNNLKNLLKNGPSVKVN